MRAIWTAMWTAAALLVAHGAPSPKVRYDQRQEGDLNVRADLENFVILVIPTTAAAAAGGGGASSASTTLSLLELLAKAIPLRGRRRQQSQEKKQRPHRKPLHAPSAEDVHDDETLSFIESKTAPYHVDISKSRTNLAKLHPNLDGHLEKEELLVSPHVSLIKRTPGEELRLPKGFVLSMPLEVEEDLVRVDKSDKVKESRKKSDLAKGKDKSLEPKLKLLLLGAEHEEECGPGYQRDKHGVCQFLAHV